MLCERSLSLNVRDPQWVAWPETRTRVNCSCKVGPTFPEKIYQPVKNILWPKITLIILGALTDDVMLGQRGPTFSDTTVFTTCRTKIGVSMAWSEYTSGGPRAPVLVGCRSSIADLVNQIVMSPRRRKASLYSGQWATLYRSFLNL